MVYRDNIIDALRYLADADYQRRAWLASSGPIVSSFSEDVCQLFDDTGLGDALDRGETVFNDTIDDKLRVFNELVRKVDYSRPPAELLESEDIANLRQFASSLLSEILATSKSDRSG